MITRENTKTVVGWLAGTGAAMASVNIIRNNRNHSESKAVDTYYDVASATGAIVVGAVAHDAVRPYSDDLVDKIFNFFEQNKTTLKSV